MIDGAFVGRLLRAGSFWELLTARAQFLRAAGLMQQKLPEQIEIVTELPAPA